MRKRKTYGMSWLLASAFTIALCYDAYDSAAEARGARGGVAMSSRGGGGFSRSSGGGVSRSYSGGGRVDRGGAGQRAQTGDRAATRQANVGGRDAATREAGAANRDAGRNRDAVRDRENRRDVERNRETNRDRNTNINNDIDIDVDDGWGDWDIDHPIAAGVAIGATAAAIGSMYYHLPPSCGWYPVYSYYYCGGVWYDPHYQGDDVTYIVVEAPEGAVVQQETAPSVP